MRAHRVADQIADRHFAKASGYYLVAAVCTLFGIIHSPLPDNRIFWPWDLAGPYQATMFSYFGGYVATALLLIAWRAWRISFPDPPTPDEAPSSLAAAP